MCRESGHSRCRTGSWSSVRSRLLDHCGHRGRNRMKSRSRCFLLLGFILNSCRAAAQPVSGFGRLDTSIESAAVSHDAVGPLRGPVGFAHAASVETRDGWRIPGYSALRKKNVASIDEFPPGVVGGAIGAAVGGAVGFVRAQMYCDNGVHCPVGGSVLTGAAIGAIMGLFVEWVVRSGPQPR
jgi:hypothetical protein